ncbi:MAG: UTP--glucose-1-phosphate uridylyltransferase GalU [Nitrospirae bacterium]|nr:UTP--glucose-1-phosphate uridylyltransferase GalU [Nitrospirota bacterium]
MEVRKAVFPAAGLGTRFLPATKASPKEMLPIVDKPMIQYAVEEAEKCGISEFVIITGKNKRAIEDHFDSVMELEVNLKNKGKHSLLNEVQRLNHLHFAFIRQKMPLGLGHAILCSKPVVHDEPFAVMLSDDIIDPDDALLQDMLKCFQKYQSPVLALQKVPKKDVSRYGIIKGTKVNKNLFKIEDLVEKPGPSRAPSNIAIIGRYILTPDIFHFLETVTPGKDGEIQLTDALKALLKTRDIYGYLFEGRRYDAGDKAGFLEATVELALKNPEVKTQFRKYLLSLKSNLKTRQE